jgi:O-antigen/teichoic acid export membrane protein
MNDQPPEPGGAALGDVTVPTRLWAVQGRRVARWTARIIEFGLVQGLVQLILAAAGLLIVRTLSKQDYALFAITNSMQTACNVLADLGIGIGVMSIGGKVWHDRRRFGQLLNTACGMRRRFLVPAVCVCLPAAAWLLARNGATRTTIAELCAALALSVIPLLTASVFSVSAQLHGEYRRMQKLDFGNAVLRVALISALALSRMNALLAILVGAINNWVQTIFLGHWAQGHADLAASPNEADRRELLRLSRSWMPNVIFFCLQGQITLVILTMVGNVTGVADLTALGRLAVLFTIISTTFSRVLTPRFARCHDTARLSRLYILLAGGTMLALVPMVLLAFFYPGPFLWLLGQKYASLTSECGFVVAAAAVSQLCGTMWSLNSSKAWIKSQSVGFIPAILVAQVMAAICLDLRQFHNVLIFNLVTASAPMPFFVLDAWRGLRSYRGPQRGAV